MPEARGDGDDVLPLEARVRRHGRDELRELRQLRDENRKLKQVVADLSLDKNHPAGVTPKKMVGPAGHRAWIGWVRDVFQVSTRRAGRATGVWRSVVCDRSRRPAQEPLRRRLRELALVRVSYGHKRLHVLLRREGWAINHQRTRRLYRKEGLQLGRYRGPKRRKRVGVGCGRPVRVAADRPNVRWGRPMTIQCDQGTEFTSIAMGAWAYWQHIPLDCSRRGTPGDNAMNEALNGSLRRKCVSQHHMMSVEDAQQVLDAWRDDYNNHRPHSSLQDLSPAQFRAWMSETPDRSVRLS